jgi:hypothetical protein
MILNLVMVLQIYERQGPLQSSHLTRDVLFVPAAVGGHFVCSVNYK